MPDTAPLPPNFPTNPGDPNHPDLAVRLLFEEQARMRSELESLRAKAAQQADGGKGEGKPEDGEEDSKEEKAPENAQSKPPARERATHWVRQHPLTAVGMVLGLIILLIASVFAWKYLSSYESTDDAFVDGHTDPIAPRIAGFVKAVYVEDTYRVKKGQLLVEIDPRDNQVAKENSTAQFSQARAAVEAQQPNVPITATTQGAQVRESSFNIASAEADVAAAQGRYKAAIADLHQAEANELNAARQEERYRLLVVKEEVSREQYDQQATAQRAQAAVVVSRRETADAAAKQVATAEASLGTAREQLRQTQQNLPRQLAMQRATLQERQASALAAKAQADQAELNLEYTRIYAPEDGIIGDKQVQLATQVAAGQEMFALTQTNDIWVTANFKETAIANVRPGQSATIHVDALKMDFEGFVEALPGGTGAVYSLLPPENATGNYVKVVQRLPVRLRFRAGQPGLERLAPGMSVVPKVWVK